MNSPAMTTTVLIQLKNTDLYSPEHIGIKDVLLSSHVVDIRDKIELTGKLEQILPKMCGPTSFNYYIFLQLPSLQNFFGATGTDVTVIDVQGDLVVPGFVDSHVHIIGMR